MADIGLLGTQAKGESGMVDAVDIFTGGAIGHESELGELHMKGVPVTELYQTLEDLLVSKFNAVRRAGSEATPALT